jgi:hypothetical protein
MKFSVRGHALLVICLAAGAVFFFACGPGRGSIPRVPASSIHESPYTITVRPIEIEDVLYNPGMGFADFHFGSGNPPSPAEYPPQTVAYFRWTWDELEPSEGRYNFGLVDNVIRQAKDRGETLAFRIMTVYKGSTPKWLLDKGVDHVGVGDDIFPDQQSGFSSTSVSGPSRKYRENRDRFRRHRIRGMLGMEYRLLLGHRKRPQTFLSTPEASPHYR